MERHDLWRRTAEWCGRSLNPDQLELLDRYRDWLHKEAVPAGGLGPAESERIDERHIADSLVFAAGLDDVHSEVADLGSGVGLPGIPLAILMPGTHYLLVDRAGRRADLMKRALRVLDLRNVTVSPREIDDLEPGLNAIVSRATLPPDQARTRFSSLLNTGGVAVIGGSWQERPHHEGWETRHIPANILGNDVWILIMRQS